ncbi:hypothetical protein NOV72_00152 [Caballeronia novacaledonica]|uniref:Uncharacterized protein n=1 Tax=Caballeronia novacaledonica TaxID=1544861 RepID=A0A2U3HYG5_9BURK|nr:hypothetical protein [Caballeronia novacaledonica]SPB12848.1 hypothetical protein NOV72_00152 [Caballeronia novacaledonica]
MNATRRAFLIAAGASGLPWISLAGASQASTRIWVIDDGLPQSRVLVRSIKGRVESLSGDAGWLWIERLSKATMPIGGLTRFADAFVLSQLGADIGMRATHHRAFADGAVLWTLERC